MWDPTPAIEALVRLAPAALAHTDPVGLREFLRVEVLADGRRRPLAWPQPAVRLRELTTGFVYDRQAQLIVPCAFAAHEMTAAALSRVRQLACPAEWDKETDRLIDDRESAVERFLEEGWGFIVNSPRLSARDDTLNHPWPLRLGVHVRLSAQEKIWFRSFECIRDG